MSFDQIYDLPPTVTPRVPTVEDIAKDALDLAIRRNYDSAATRFQLQDAKWRSERRDAVRILLAALPWLAEDVKALGEGK